MKRYLKSVFSVKKITHRSISLFSLWDPKTSFGKKTGLHIFARLTDVSVGDYSFIGSFCNITKTKIGRFSCISKNALISVSRHPTNCLSTNVVFYRPSKCKNHPEWIKKIDFEEYKEVTIGNDVWIGINCTVMGGVTIGDGAIIALGSVVTKDIPPYAIAGGVPARVLKYRFPEDVIARLLEIKWWNLSDDEITRVLPVFHEPEINIAILDKYFHGNN